MFALTNPIPLPSIRPNRPTGSCVDQWKDALGESAVAGAAHQSDGVGPPCRRNHSRTWAAFAAR